MENKISKVIKNNQDKFDDGWKHWIFLSDIKTGVNFNMFRDGIKSHLPNSQIELLRAMCDNLEEGKSKNPAYMCYSDVNRALERQINTIRETIDEISETP